MRAPGFVIKIIWRPRRHAQRRQRAEKDGARCREVPGLAAATFVRAMHISCATRSAQCLPRHASMQVYYRRRRRPAALFPLAAGRARRSPMTAFSSHRRLYRRCRVDALMTVKVGYARQGRHDRASGRPTHLAFATRRWHDEFIGRGPFIPLAPTRKAVLAERERLSFPARAGMAACALASSLAGPPPSRQA